MLLDTHALLWSLLDDPHLSRAARAALADPANEILISAVSIFELTLKHHIGKLNQAGSFVRHHERVLADLDWHPLPVGIKHASVAGNLDIPHKDPFDRMLIAQAQVEGVALVSDEALFDRFGIERLW